jgi:inosine-uridine nucleoside N-ribohydrolase
MFNILKRHFLLIAALSYLFTIPALAHVPNIIYDTDFGPDIDDVAALAILHNLADNGEANILAAMVSSSHYWSPGGIDAVNTYYGRPNIPIGGRHISPRPGGHAYVKTLANSNYGNDIKSADDVPNSVVLYRQLLNKQPNQSVTIVSVGFLTNLSDLIDTPANYNGDGIMKTGLQLVREKVEKWVVMGGRYPEGTEFNFARGGEASNGVGPFTLNAVTKWPTPIVFLGAEIGAGIRTGLELANIPADNPVRVAYESFFATRSENDRPSWDQTAVLYAVRGSFFQGTTYWTEVKQGYNEITNETGVNNWRASPDKDHTYVVKSLPTDRMEEIIEGLMVQKPISGWPNLKISSNVLLYYDFSNGSGTSVTDLSGHGNHGMLVGFNNTSGGTGVFNTSEGWLTEGGLSFLDGAADEHNYVETPLPLNALYDFEQEKNKSFTIEVVANWSGSTGWSPIIGSNFGCAFSKDDAFFMGLHRSLNGIHLRVPGGHTKTFSGQGNPWITADAEAHHIAMTFDQNTQRVDFFIDGGLVGNATFTDINFDSRSLFRIGNTGWSGTEQWGGIIYSLAISGILLSPDEFVLSNSNMDASL